MIFWSATLASISPGRRPEAFRPVKLFPARKFKERFDNPIMKITLAGTLDLGLKVMDIEGTKITLRQLLARVDKQHDRELQFFDPATGELEELFKINVNGQDCQYLPGRLDTVLKDGDLVEIAILAVGGG
jgi:molybdopterin converting factor small subunit